MTGMTDREIVKACRIGRYSFEPQEAADAIERLIKERDEAIEALRVIAIEPADPNDGVDHLKASRSVARSILSKYEAKP